MQRNDYAESLIELLKTFNKASRTIDMSTKAFNGGWRKSTHCPHRKVITVHAIAPSPESNSNYYEKGICRKKAESCKDDFTYMWMDSIHNCPDCKIDICPLLKEVDGW